MALSFKQAKFLALGLRKLKKVGSVAGDVVGEVAPLAVGAGLGAGASYGIRAFNRATFGRRKKNQISVDEFNRQLSEKNYFGRARMYGRASRGTLNIEGSSTRRPFAGKLGARAFKFNPGPLR